MKKSLTIMHTESHRQWGGQERRVFSECRWMNERGHRVVLAAPAGSPIFENARAQGWETCGIPFTRASLPVDIARVRSLIKRVRPDVFNTHGNTDTKAGLTATWNLGVPCVIRTRHSSVPVGDSWYNRILYRDLAHLIFTTAACISNQLEKDLKVPGHRIHTFASGITPPAEFPDRETARKELAGELGINENARFFGCVSRLSEGKGIEFLLEAFDEIRGRVPDYHLVLVGDGGFEGELKTRVRDNQIERVHFTGYRKNPWPYYRAFDCKVLASSKYEGIPQVLLEAMFASCPVIGTNTGGIPDIIVHNETGLLVPPDNARRLAEALLAVATDRNSAASRSENAFQYASRNHTLDIMGERIIGLYHQTIAATRCRPAPGDRPM